MLKSSSSSEPLEARGNRARSSLDACLRSGRLPHAVLVEDSEGSVFAREIAKAALCSADGEKPCGHCRDCFKAEKGAHPDMIIAAGGEKALSFHIDAIRELRREAYIRPNEAERKVFILENAHNMTVQAQNALLKIIEEPPSRVMFILVCENRAAMLETVLSRVTVFSPGETADAADGEQEEDGPRAKTASALDALLSGSECEALAAFAPYERDRAGMARFLAAMREEAAARVLDGARAGNEPRGQRERLIGIIGIIDELELALKQNTGGLLMTVMLPAMFKAAMKR